MKNNYVTISNIQVHLGCTSFFLVALKFPVFLKSDASSSCQCIIIIYFQLT